MAILLILRGSQLMHPHAHQLPRSLKVRIPKLILAPAINPCRGTWVLAILRLLPSIIEVTKLTHNPRTTKVKPPMFIFPGFFGRLHQMPIGADIKTLHGMLGLYNWRSLITAFLVSVLISPSYSSLCFLILLVGVTCEPGALRRQQQSSSRFSLPSWVPNYRLGIIIILTWVRLAGWEV